MAGSDQTKKPFKLRSQRWFDDPEDPGMTALYLERFLNYGLTPGELQSGRPVIGIAQSAALGRFKKLRVIGGQSGHIHVAEHATRDHAPGTLTQRGVTRSGQTG